MIDIDDNDILTWEIQLQKEGTLPPDVQGVLLKFVKREIVALGRRQQRRALVVPA